MTTTTSCLPKCLRWVFCVFSVFAALGAVAILVLWIVDPRLPAGTHFGPIPVDLLGQPGTVVLRAANGDSDLSIMALHGDLSVSMGQAGGLVEIVKHYGLPLVFINLIFFVVLFDLLCRLFRNVARGESFTRQSVVLVQSIGVSLLVFSLVSAFAESWFSHAIYGYLVQHAMISISGTPLHLPVEHGFSISGGHGSPFGAPVFWSGLLVLALSEVFRQGLALKSENDLTV